MNTLSWADVTLNPLDLLLDKYNPRIYVPDNAAQDDIRLQLLMHEGVIELANAIITERRLLPGDRIITCVEDGVNVVLEGNRRVCACQLLLNPTLIPPEFERRFPKADSEELVLNISRIKADLAPNRAAAEHILTKRHTEPGIKEWSPMAKIRRVARWFNKGQQIKEISDRLSASQATVRKTIRDYHLLKYVIDLPGWTEDEMRILTNEKLAINPYTRFFTLKGVKEILQFDFDENERLKSALSEEVFNGQMRCVAEAFLLPAPGDKKPWANTRTSVKDVLGGFMEDCQSGPSGQEQGDKPDSSGDEGNNQDNTADKGKGQSADAQKDSNEKSSNNGTKQQRGKTKLPGPDKFFENVSCYIDNPFIKQLTLEIRMINHILSPVAATMLLRSLLESTLYHQIEKYGKIDEMCPNGEDPTLQKVMNFCVNNPSVFKHQRARSVLRSFNGSGFKDHFDLVVHGKWAQANTQILESAASVLRPFIAYILSDEKRGY